MSILNKIFSHSAKKKVTIKKYKKLSYEQSILEAARELKNISTHYSFVAPTNYNLVHKISSAKPIHNEQKEAMS